METIADQSGFSSVTLSPSRGASRSPAGPGLHRRVSRLYDGSERIRVPEEVKLRQASESLEDSTSAPSTGASPAAARRQPSFTPSVVLSPDETSSQSNSLPRSASVSNPPPPLSSTIHSQTNPQPGDLRRARSEILDPSEKRRARRPTILSTPRTATVRERSTSDATSGSRSAEISQTRALAHEAILEERREAVARRQQEDNRMLSKAKHAKRSWRNWFFKAPDDAD